VAGRKVKRYLSRTSADGTVQRIPVGVIQGTRPGDKVTVFAGQHGTEYDGIEAAQRLFRTIDPEQVRGTIVVGLVINMRSFEGWIQFAPTSPEISAMMRELAEGSSALINCHGGEFSEGMCPYVICRLVGREDLDQKAMEMARAFKLPYISVSRYRGEPPPDPSGARPAWWLWPRKSMADELQIPEITPEVGQRGSRDDDGLMYGGIVNVLRRLDVLDGDYLAPAEEPRIIGERYWITASAEGTFFPEVDVCQDVEVGQRLGLLRDYFGDVIEEVVAPASAKVMNMNWGMPVQKDGFLMWLGEMEDTAPRS
jgi:predicted deacylase